MRVALAPCACVLICLAGAAQAHQTKLSSTQLTLGATEATALLELNAADLEAVLDVPLTEASGAVTPARLAAHADAVLRYVEQKARLGVAGGADCAQSAAAPKPAGEHVRVALTFRCPPTGQPREYRISLFHELDPAARHVVTVQGAQRRFALLGVANPRLGLAPASGGLAETLGHYLLAGIEHIAIGYDHIAFLLAVIVPGGGFWTLFAAITAFTVAHSITLSLAVLGVVVPPARAIEVLIAASIVYVAAENLFLRDPRGRWGLTFAFGLVHGFGFAGALREYGVPAEALAPALFAFNAGVELGQLVIVAAAVLAWRAALALRLPGGTGAAAHRRLVPGVSAAVLALGVWWLGERLFQ